MKDGRIIPVESERTINKKSHYCYSRLIPWQLATLELCKVAHFDGNVTDEINLEKGTIAFLSVVLSVKHATRADNTLVTWSKWWAMVLVSLYHIPSYYYWCVQWDCPPSGHRNMLGIAVPHSCCIALQREWLSICFYFSLCDIHCVIQNTGLCYIAVVYCYRCGHKIWADMLQPMNSQQLFATLYDPSTVHLEFAILFYLLYLFLKTRVMSHFH